MSTVNPIQRRIEKLQRSKEVMAEQYEHMDAHLVGLRVAESLANDMLASLKVRIEKQLSRRADIVNAMSATDAMISMAQQIQEELDALKPEPLKSLADEPIVPVSVQKSVADWLAHCRAENIPVPSELAGFADVEDLATFCCDWAEFCRRSDTPETPWRGL